MEAEGEPTNRQNESKSPEKDEEEDETSEEEEEEEAPSSSSVPTTSSSSAASLTIRQQQRMAKHGMAFLLQQIRSNIPAQPSSNITGGSSSTTNTAEPASKKAKLTTPAAEPPPQPDSTIITEAEVEKKPPPPPKRVVKKREDLALPPQDQQQQEFWANLRPLQVVADCFCQSTVPDFGPHIRRLIGQNNNYVRSCKWSPDGQWLVSDSIDRIVRIFAFSGEEEKLQLHQKLPFGGLVYDLQWSPSMVDEPNFATTSQGQPIHCWTPDGQLVATFRGANDKDELDTAHSLCYSLDGQQMFAGFRNHIRLFAMDRPGRPVRSIQTFKKGAIGAQQRGILSALAMCPTFEGAFAVGSYAGALGLYSTQTNACDSLIEPSGGGPAITHLQYTADGTKLLVGYRKNPLIKCYDLRMASTGRVLATFKREATTSQRFDFQLDPYDRYLYSGSNRGELLIYEFKDTEWTGEGENSKEPGWRVKCSEAAVTGLSLHPSAQLVAVSTGQRVFPKVPFPFMEGEEEDKEEEKKKDVNEEDAAGYIGFGKNSPLDNAIKMYKMC